MTTPSMAEHQITTLLAWVLKQFSEGTLNPSLAPHLSNELEAIRKMIAQQEDDHRQDMRDARADVRELEANLNNANARAEGYY